LNIQLDHLIQPLRSTNHYSPLNATTNWSAPVPCIGTLILMVFPFGFLPYHQDDWFP